MIYSTYTIKWRCVKMLELEQIPKIVVCDDNPEIHKEIEVLLTEYTVSHQCGEFIFEAFSNGESLLACHRKIDLLFLDIELGELSGIDIVPIMQERFPDIIIIFVSSYMQYFIHSCRLGVFQFLTKPFDKRIFFEELDRFYIKYGQKAALYNISYKGTAVNFPITEILYIEAALRYLHIYHEQLGKYEKIGQIGKEEKFLKPYGFIRCHNGYLVNARYIDNIKNQIVYLKNPRNKKFIEIPVSKNKLAKAKKEYQYWLLKEEI